MTYKKIYNIILNSFTGIPEVTDINNDVTYYINWDKVYMPNTSYHMKFSFVSATNGLQGDIFVPKISIDAFSNVYNYENTVADGLVQNGHIGTLKINNVLNNDGTNNTFDNYLYSNFDDNPPCYLEGKPMSNTIRVRILNDEGSLYTNTAGSFSEYTLILSFIPLE